ncbi:hypothetical protein [Goodfellowiella coeruleoviolacea]|uniref:Uncharacterized protein n=1 Tax=Goodfellowiella coeruleoviolacea TaxID=334858 RepID=A0AAE3KKN7_9PSEU|nr:hypothetical protein [Goodfellowiella coeruleoviolacea]MCP2170347.1 hypothetical protein [Goodfellowiella coeruleoviolacea]
MSRNDHVWWHGPDDKQSHAFRTAHTTDPTRTVYRAAGECGVTVQANEVIRETTKTPCTLCLLATMVANLPVPAQPDAAPVISDAELRRRCPLLADRLTAFCVKLRSSSPPSLHEMRDLARSMVLLGGSMYDRADAGTAITVAVNHLGELADRFAPRDGDQVED